ncbi:hypothetical protein PENSPDRAFT_667471 [Peniophora sp. CONT]|nr:hypothetical protein PENSPDRAFT_667471 [Peniophora sp. CONT]
MSDPTYALYQSSPPQTVYQPYPFAICGNALGIPPPTMIGSELPASAELLTYSLAGKLAYVPAGKTYEEALDHAVAAFPSLKPLERSRISLHVAGRDALVRVTGGAWSSVLKDLPKYEIVTVEIEQLVEDAPPQYDMPKTSSDKLSSSPYKDVRRRRGVFGWLKTLFGKA